MSASRRTPTKVRGKEVSLSNLDKVFYPATGFTKGDVIDFYREIAPVLLPHLKDRPITLKRYPDGVEGSFFYEKQCPSHAPEWIKTTPVEKGSGEVIHYCLIQDEPSLVWAANMANLELHPFQHRARALTRPTALVFDLDPGPPADVLDCARVAVRIRDLFLGLKLQTFVKTSGSKGLQLVLPLNTSVTYERTKEWALAVAELLASKFPNEVISKMTRALRKGKVFIDWSQNDDTKTTVAVYSLRAKERPTVSTPLEWEELENALRKKKASALVFDTKAVLKRVKAKGDFFAEVLTLKQKLPTLGRSKLA
ncbi:non-homologous end-joining DNA ligase [Verrucomicrobium sp. BvORR106]|uniref:non-homologous end-joining DNA ligase n=1 Tax=Verrucomicrobium sp. BvORR106 TaxID=1403819 RepID=UPI0005702E44|nr:non-homologous end-joining DNA ligase [Verrucomicrobium sp. BvORR106]